MKSVGADTDTTSTTAPPGASSAGPRTAGATTTNPTTMTKPLPERLRTAADTIEELSALYGYSWPDTISWDAQMLRNTADGLWATTPTKEEQ